MIQEASRNHELRLPFLAHHQQESSESLVRSEINVRQGWDLPTMALAARPVPICTAALPMGLGRHTPRLGDPATDHDSSHREDDEDDDDIIGSSQHVS